MPEPISPEILNPGETKTIPGEWRSGEDAQREFETTSMKGAEAGRAGLDEPTPVAVQARRSSLFKRFFQRFSRISQ